ncbi:hypothetical protein GDO81_010623 [Engystomops pustulosus]|uniref:Uncharacterized protein n=1 Tax=Engystomops pustulosus TaxID=76066 RepID=A0AAV7C2F0_ENGPU|nr:hypothetical protein GDO81_010623 [Engystomops pustulosus]
MQLIQYLETLTLPYIIFHQPLQHICCIYQICSSDCNIQYVGSTKRKKVHVAEQILCIYIKIFLLTVIIFSIHYLLPLISFVHCIHASPFTSCKPC